jgi:hypothetical protein
VYADDVEPTALSWQERILQSVPSGIDLHQLERFLKLSPTEQAKTAAGRVKDIADLAFIAELEKRR